MKDRSEDLKAEYEGAEEICAGSAFHMNGAFIKNEKRKYSHGMTCTVMS